MSRTEETSELGQFAQNIPFVQDHAVCPGLTDSLEDLTLCASVRSKNNVISCVQK